MADALAGQLKEMGLAAARSHAPVSNKTEWEAELQKLSPAAPPSYRLSKTLIFKPSKPSAIMGC